MADSPQVQRSSPQARPGYFFSDEITVCGFSLFRKYIYSKRTNYCVQSSDEREAIQVITQCPLTASENSGNQVRAI